MWPRVAGWVTPDVLKARTHFIFKRQTIQEELDCLTLNMKALFPSKHQQPLTQRPESSATPLWEPQTSHFSVSEVDIVDIAIYIAEIQRDWSPFNYLHMNVLFSVRGEDIRRNETSVGGSTNIWSCSLSSGNRKQVGRCCLLKKSRFSGNYEKKSLSENAK